MNDRMNLKEWLSIHKDPNELRSLFYQLDRRMKYIHEKGYYISKFNLEKIEITQQFVDFLELYPLDKAEWQKDIDSNIYTMACLEVASYSNFLNLFHPQFFTEHFDEFKPFLPKDDVPYYKRIFQDKKYSYFSDYVSLVEEQRKKQNTEEPPNAISNTNQRSYVKATSVGKMYSGDETNLNSSAYINIVLLTSFVVFISFITLLGIILTVLR